MSTAAPRNPGYFDEYQLVHHSFGLDNGVIVAAQYKKGTQVLSLGALRSAALRVVPREPALRLGVANLDLADPKFISCKVDEATLTDIVTASSASGDNNTSFSQLINEEAAKPHPRPGHSGPLWRVVLCQDNMVVFCYHHGIGDGISGIAFHKMVLQALNTEDTFTSREITYPPMEECMDILPPWFKLLSEVGKLLLPASWKAGYSAWTGNDVPNLTLSASERVKPQVTFIEYSCDDVARLLTLCRQHGSTLTSALYVILVTVFSRAILETQNPPPHITSISPLTVMSLRHLTRAPDDVFCNHVTGWQTYPKLCTTFDWEHAQEIATTLKIVRNNASDTGMLKYVHGKMESVFRGLTGKKRVYTFALSNMGVLPKECTTGDGWTIGKTAFSSSSVLAGPTFNVDVIGHGDGGITVGLTSDPRSLDEQFAQRIVTDFQKEVQRLIAREQ